MYIISIKLNFKFSKILKLVKKIPRTILIYETSLTYFHTPLVTELMQDKNFNVSSIDSLIQC